MAAQEGRTSPGAPVAPGVPPAVDLGVTDEPGRRRGRRPAGSDTRGEILAAARAELAGRGYDGASVRAVARRAEVDPALVRHYFADKAELFAAAMVPEGVDPARLVPSIVAGDLEGLGERLARGVMEVWEARDGESFRALFAALASSEPHLRAMAAFLGREVFGRVTAVLPSPDAELRMALVASQVAGVLVVRHVMRLPEVTALSTAELAALVGPVLQAYLTGPLPERGRAHDEVVSDAAAQARARRDPLAAVPAPGAASASPGLDDERLASGSPREQYSSHEE